MSRRRVRIASASSRSTVMSPTCALPCWRPREARADVVTVWDHFFPLFGDPTGKHFECSACSPTWFRRRRGLVAPAALDRIGEQLGIYLGI